MHSPEPKSTPRSAATLWPFLLPLLLVLLPFSVEGRVARDGTAVLVRVPMTDALIIGTTLLFAILGAFGMDFWRRSLLPALVVPAVSMLATLPKIGSGATVSESLQRMDYFLLAYILAAAAPARAMRITLGPVFTAVTSLFLLIAGYQVVILGDPAWRIMSLFEDRHLFGGWVALALATLTARYPFRSPLALAGAAALVLLALATATTLLPLVGLAAGMVVAGYSINGLRGAGVAVAAAAMVVALFIGIAPDAHAGRSLEAWLPNDAGTLQEFHQRGAEIDSLGSRLLLGTTTIAGKFVEVLSPNWHPAVEPPLDPHREIRFEPGYLRQRYLEWQAALNAADENPLLGSGLGSYQRRVSANYLTFKKLKTLEPDTQSGYAVELVSTGLLGLIALAWFFIFHSRRLLQWLRRQELAGENGYLRSLLAGLATAAIIGLAIPLFTCFLAVPVVFMAAARPEGAGPMDETG